MIADPGVLSNIREQASPLPLTPEQSKAGRQDRRKLGGIHLRGIEALVPTVDELLSHRP